jgi:hypothetical protein
VQYHVEISNRSTALENSDAEVDINRAWETIRVKGKRSLRRPRHRWVDDIKMDLRERMGWYGLD